MNATSKSMETRTLSDFDTIVSGLNGVNLPRGIKLPWEFRTKMKIREGKNTLSAVARAYEVQRSQLSKVILGQRNTPHLIRILEAEYGMSIAEIRDIWQRDKEKKLSAAKSAEKQYFEAMIQKGETNE